MTRLRHSNDPRLRSFLVNGLSPMGADASMLAAELDRIDATAGPELAQGMRRMDDILYHPETSKLRALILALGTYKNEGLSTTERDRLTRRLLDHYRQNPDSGVHGAAEWALRSWGQDEKLENIQASLPSAKDRGDRRWFVNSQGQTFAVIGGPVDFLMGSPPWMAPVPENERPHRRIIRHRFAISTKEVTVGQYMEYLREKPGGGEYEIDRSSPVPTGPINGTSWYDAAGFCNWLSRKEGLPQCYEPNAAGEYAQGMKVPVDVLRRKGYRLPTEAEWEYSCRAGTQTTRYYGHSEQLVPRYSWYVFSAQEHAWPCGTLMPNDLGLFDMLGNLTEWCHSRDLLYEPDRDGSIEDETNFFGTIGSNTSLMLRGGCFLNFPSLLRSGYRFRSSPGYHSTVYGFRIAITCE